MRKPNTTFATKQTPDNASSQAGFAAILVTLIVVGLITLMTIGFLQVVSREGRDSLDRQLSTQAFYAAETAVNDAQQLMRSNDLITAKTECDVSGPGWNPELSAGIEYTCVLTEMDLEELYYQNIGIDRARGIRLNAVDTGGSVTEIGQVNLAWRTRQPDVDSPPLGASGSQFPPAGDNSGFGPHGLAPVLRVTITPLSGPNALHRQSLVENTYTTFLRPTSDGSNATAAYEAGATNVASQGTIQQVDCNSGDMCNFTIRDLNFTNALLTVRAIYGEAELTIDSDSDIRFRGEQVIIDATGRAGDVLRRIQVRLSDDGGAQVPPFAIEAAAGICKDYEIGASSSSVECSIN